MKFTIVKDDLARVLAHGQNVVEKRTTVPILSHFLLEAADDHVTLTFTDLELTLVEAVPAVVKSPGKIAVPAHRFHEVVRKLRDGDPIDVDLQTESRQLHVVSGHSEFMISCLAPDDFPVVQRTTLPVRFGVPAQDFYRLLDHVRFAMSTEEARYYLNGVLLHLKDDTELRAVATDGHRLARASLAVAPIKAFPQVIMSRKCVNEVVKLLADTQDNIDISLSDTQISFEAGSAFLTSRLIDGTFPDYEPVIPIANDKVLVVDVKQFAEAVDRVATMASDKENGIRLQIKNNSLKITAASTDAGRGQDEIAVEYTLPELEIGFNARYLLDITQKISAQDMEMTMSDPSSPALIRDTRDTSALFVVMPMRV